MSEEHAEEQEEHTQEQSEEHVERNPMGDPQQSLFAILGTPSVAARVESALEGAGFRADAVALFSSQGDADELDEDEQGGLFSGLRKAFAGDQTRVEAVYAQAIRDGNIVIQVHIDEADEAARERAKEVLIEEGAHYLHYFGAWSYQELEGPG